MREIGGFVDVSDSRPLPGTEWSLVTDRDAASRHGVSISGLGMMIKMLTRGMRISDYRPDDSEDELDVVMRFMGDQRNLDRLKSFACQQMMLYVHYQFLPIWNPRSKAATLNARRSALCMSSRMLRPAAVRRLPSCDNRWQKSQFLVM